MRRTPEEVEELALRAAGQASNLRTQVATAQELVDAGTAAMTRLKGRATRMLAHYASYLRRSSSNSYRPGEQYHPWAEYTRAGQEDLMDIQLQIVAYL